jgi:hypothetical protein
MGSNSVQFHDAGTARKMFLWQPQAYLIQQHSDVTDYRSIFFSFVNVEQASAMFKEPRKILFVLMFYSSVQNSWGNIVCLERIVYVDISSPLCCTT